MKVKIIKTTKGSENGIIVNTYEQGTECEMQESLARSFIKMGVAIEVSGEVEPVREIKKAVEPENKMAEVSENKAPKKRK